MRIVHLYPFAPVGSHGGTMRLCGAVAAFHEFPQVVWTFNNEDDAWRELRHSETVLGPVELADAASVKRWLWPSTLWESGRAAVAAARSTVLPTIAPDDTVVLHTTYLGKLASEIEKLGASVIQDAYDLVWRAHEIDAQRVIGFRRLIRRAYSRTVRLREMSAIGDAGHVVFAGWADYGIGREAARAASWVPTAVKQLFRVRTESTLLRVGFIGNFRHRPTVDSARMLLRSPVASEAGVSLIFAGTGSDSVLPQRTPAVCVLGPVRTPDDFYDAVDCVAVPVVSGAGVKVKIAEAVLAGRAVVTTPLGAAGFPPELRQYLTTVEPSSIARDTCVSAMQEDLEAAARAFGRDFSPAAVGDAYRRVLAAVR